VWQSNIRHGNEILEIIENNATIQEHYKARYLQVIHVSDRYQAGENCPIGSCGRVLIDSQYGFLNVYVNYEEGFVADCFEQKFNPIYWAIFNCAGDRIGKVRLHSN
jgi:hypothetical protein